MEFSKLSGSGNDFIIIDNMDLKIDADSFVKLVPKICRRAISVGADGVILIEPSDRADFKWRFFNSDGSEAEMCGNGGRCAARFACEKGIAPQSMVFETLAGLIRAEVQGRLVKVQMTEPFGWVMDKRLEDLGVTYCFVNTGVPHVVVFVEDLESMDVVGLGRKIRFHSQFQPAGTNVNFVTVKDGKVFIRTYERGVEGETFACGTGATAAALIGIKKGLVVSPVEVVTRSGEVLKIYEDNDKVFLEGLTRWIYDGVLSKEAWLD
ncbi:diaminopimelate epimerase [Thermosulfidibacter takaii ABI70S6]|uniref:Diaminopimelate epimerase n=1 Tax=Thermosulfidibacter takaii (strain DSM 17441 / JCM 13301 / NBRC 103674 / ABI70S6) TaxID=1298851 RepID=A0A0S3QU62_THET7|nr:diaminopimelate epimerase [Thermosulfidibacter takaii]BAT71861.1 diaminopimelate epimerase [Thermosulfidibacter takaii ABI70S6]